MMIAHLRKLTSLLGLLAAGYLCFAQPAWGQDAAMRLRLKDGSFSRGNIVPSSSADRLGWQADGFATKFDMDVDALRSVSTIAQDSQLLDKAGGPEDESDSNSAARPAEAPAPSLYFEMADGAMVVGQLRGLTDEWVTVESTLFGELQIERRRVLAISDAQYAGRVLYRGPLDDKKWSFASGEGDWQFEAGALTTSKQGAVAIGDVELPSKAQVDVVLAWTGVADFVFSFGTTASNQISKAEQVPAAARLEVWGKQLALVREVEGGADIALVSDLTGAIPRIELTLFIDQEAGVVTVCDSHGRPLDTVTAVGKRVSIRKSVHLVNHGPSLTLEHFEVREWDGLSTQLGAYVGGRVVLADGTMRKANLVGFEPATGEFLLEEADSGAESKMTLEQLRRGDVKPIDGKARPAQPAEKKAEDTAVFETAGEDASQSAASIEVIFSDRTRLQGQWLPAQDGMLRFAPNGLKPVGDQAALSFLPEYVSGLIGNSQRYSAPIHEQRTGTLKLEETQLAGYLEPDSSATPRTTPLHWHPSGSLSSSPLLPTASGAIVYRKSLPTVAKEQPVAQPNVNRAIPMINIFLGGNREERPKEEPQKEAKDAPEIVSREILFRTGDAIEGVVVGIDEQGLHFKSEQTTTTFASHDLVQSVALNRQVKTTKQSSEKLERLMTVPRSMKQDPPTHLFISVTGDYLRGRLVRLADGVLTVEVRLEQLEIPVTQVARIIWLHDREWEQKDKDDSEDTGAEASPQNPFRVHVIGVSDRGLTFVPQAVKAGVISGVSELLGECSVAIEDANQILFGRDIASRVREYREDPWTLSLAQYPRVYLEQDEAGGGGSSAGTQSPLVGKPAPVFGLQTLDDKTFRLRESRDQVVVLDFWASWCGPCVQTMPLVEKAVEELGADRVRLVAVNIQEAPARVARAVESLGLEATVLLDVDGEVAAAYQANAIPQTVIIDKEGNVRHVFVGGGAGMVAQFKNALEAVLGDAKPEPAVN